MASTVCVGRLLFGVVHLTSPPGMYSSTLGVQQSARAPTRSTLSKQVRTEIYSLFEPVVDDFAEADDMLVVAFLHDGNLAADGFFGGTEHGAGGIAGRVGQRFVVFLDAIDGLDSLNKQRP